MAKNKYLKDYRVDEYLDSRGRLRRQYVYAGAYFRYPEDERTTKKSWLLVLILCAVSWAAFVGGMCLLSAAMKTVYTAIPYAFIALALGLLTKRALTGLTLPVPFEQRYADQFGNSYPVVSLACVILAAVSLLGQGINLLRGMEMLAGDALFAGCAAVVGVCGALAFRMRGRFTPREEK